MSAMFPRSGLGLISLHAHAMQPMCPARKRRGFNVARFDILYGERKGKPTVMNFCTSPGFVCWPYSCEAFWVIEAGAVLLPYATTWVRGSHGPGLQQLGGSKSRRNHAVHLEQFHGPPVSPERVEWQPPSKQVAGMQSDAHPCGPEVGADLPHGVVGARLLCR